MEDSSSSVITMKVDRIFDNLHYQNLLSLLVVFQKKTGSQKSVKNRALVWNLGTEERKWPSFSLPFLLW